MNELPGPSHSATFRRRITIALAALAAIAFLQGGFAVLAVGLAEHHVLRGRVAADIKQSFTDLWLDKQRLRNFVAQKQFGDGAASDRRDEILETMRRTLDRLNALAAQASLLDDGIPARQRQAERQAALAILSTSVEQLARGLAGLDQPSSALGATAEWRIANDLFDNADGRDLQSLLAESLAREQVSLDEKRADTDQALAWLRRLWIGTTAALILAALVLAAAFARALHKPLAALAEGAEALRNGRLSHRITLDISGEFGKVAHSMNVMAEELSAHRTREREAREVLEDRVARRTAELTVALAAQSEAESRRRQLFADISHELRTPTTAIRGEAQIALRGGAKPASEYQESLQRVEDYSRQLGATIDDLLTMARSDIDSLSLRKVPVDIDDVLEEVFWLGRALAFARGVELAREPWPTGLTMLGDAERLKQLLLVLIDNAVRYSWPGGTVTLSACRTQNGAPWAEITVSDVGIGIEESELGKVFDRGHRAPNAKMHCSDGSGLGLPIARVLARGHGGDIVLKSGLHRGTAAILSLPLAIAPHGHPA
jgi:two-component system, OmpR family, sensor kinase